MRRTAGLVAGVLAVVLLLTGTGVTLAAWTTDEVTVEGATFTAGGFESMTIVPVDVPQIAVAMPGEPYVARYKAILTKTGDNLLQVSAAVAAEVHHWVADKYADAASVRVVFPGAGSGSGFTYDYANGAFLGLDSAPILSFGESDTLEIQVEIQVESTLTCTDWTSSSAQTVGGGQLTLYMDQRRGSVQSWRAEASVGLPEVTVAGEDDLFDVVLSTYDYSPANRTTLISILRQIRPDLSATDAEYLIDYELSGSRVTILEGVDTATAESARVALEAAGVGAWVELHVSEWQGVRDEPSGEEVNVVFWSGNDADVSALVSAFSSIGWTMSPSDVQQLIDEAPRLMADDMPTATAEYLKAAFEAAGATLKFQPSGGSCW